MSRIKMLDLFSGIGGFAIAADLVGDFETVAFCEIDQYCQKVLSLRYPGIPIFNDVTTLTAQSLRDKGITQIDAICGGFPCFVAGTLVLTENGYQAIETLEVGQKVLTHLGQWKSITSLMRKNDAEIIEVKINGYVISTTSEHPFYVSSKYRKNGQRFFSPLEWVEAKDLTPGKHNVSMILPSEKTCDLDDETLWLLGRYVADGWYQDRKDRKSGGRVVFGIGKHKSKDFDSHLHRFHATKAEDRTATKFHICSNELYECVKQFGKGASNKVIPSWVLSLPICQASVFLDGYISGDGSFSESQIKATTCSKNLAFSLACLIQKVYCVVPSIHFVQVPEKTIIEGRIVNQKPQWQVAATIRPKRNAVQVIQGDYALKPVRKIQKNGTTGTVYNISVQDDESYIADGCIVHNCQDLSNAGKQAGLEGKRSGLFFEIVRLVREIRPRVVILENVAALLGRGMERVLWEFAQIGYDAEWSIVSCAEVGGCHRRERIWIVAYPRSK